MVGFTSGFAPLSARPPTPPKESSSVYANGSEGTVTDPNTKRPLLDTPEESPSSSADLYKESSEKSRKKVGFSPWTEFHRLPTKGNRESDSESSVRRLPPSKDCKTLKSILKPGLEDGASLPGLELLQLNPTSLPNMLRATNLHLSRPARVSRMDAYTTLLGCLSAYNDVPDLAELSEVLFEMAGYIRRDVSAKVHADGTLDTQLIAQALKVLTALISIPNLAGQLPEDFCFFILDRSLSSLEDTTAPKILVTHYMHFLETQKFGPKQLTSDRANKIISALDSVTDRIKGNRVVCHRLMIYQRLLGLTKAVMVARINNWIDHLISGMLSTIKDIRIRAIAFGTAAGLQLGSLSTISQTICEVLNRVSSEGKKVVDFFALRLTDMVSSKEEGIHVAQIWSVVILLLRGRRRRLETWEHMRLWLGLIQKCINTSEPAIKLQAHIAWSRLIFSVNLDALTSPAMARMLRQPLVTQMERRSNDKNVKRAKQNARATYCTLLYYAFRPGATPAQLDQYWDLYVAQVLPVLLAADKSEFNFACSILARLLSGPARVKAWDENRANLNGSVSVEELPCVDAKWLRSNAGRVMQIFDILPEQESWLSGEEHEAPVLLLWRNFMAALGTAASKEVKVSAETMQAISHIVNKFRTDLDAGNGSPVRTNSIDDPSPHTGNMPDRFERVRLLWKEVTIGMGPIPLLERRVVVTPQNNFEVAETPSSRVQKPRVSAESAATHLISLLLQTAREQENPSVSYVEAVKTVLASPLQSTSTRRAKLNIIRHLTNFLVNIDTLDRQADRSLWTILTEATTSALDSPQIRDSHQGNSQYSGHDYKDAVKILELGIQYQSPGLNQAWINLYDRIASLIYQEAGADGVSLLLAQPLALILRNHSVASNERVLVVTTSFLNMVNVPEATTTFDRAHRIIWGSAPNVVAAAGMGRVEDLYTIMGSSLAITYQRFHTLSVDRITAFLAAAKGFVSRCPSSHYPDFLQNTQIGFAFWIEDPENVTSIAASQSQNSLLTHVSYLRLALVA